MNVASLELSKELLKLAPTWNDTHAYYEGNHGLDTDNKETGELYFRGQEGGTGEHAQYMTTGDYPAYDLGYLLRKLPNQTAILKLDAGYLATHDNGYQVLDGVLSNKNIADTPEDAAAKLCIELIKQKVLTP